MTKQSIDSIKKSLASVAEKASAFNTCSTGVSNTFTYSAHASSNYTRQEYTRYNYNNVRPSERVPSTFVDSLMFSNESYYTISIVRNIVDLMADFCVKGLDWAHPNRNVQSFMRSWYNKVDGNNISERFCNYLIRLGNLCLVPEYSKIPDMIAQEWRKTRGAEFKEVKVSNLRIPSSYTFIDVTALTEKLDSTSTTSNRVFSLCANGGLISTFSNHTTGYRLQSGTTFSGRLYQSLPPHIRNKVHSSSGLIELKENEDVYIYHYRKDDWDTWARPIILSIAEPLIMLKKMHLADSSALDGVISNVRLWRVGYIDQTNVLNSVIPEPYILEKIRDMIKANISGGVLDIVWGPDLDFKESSSNSYEFLYPEKYSQVMAEIYDGFGINPGLAGGLSSNGQSGMSNNAISMKVLVERLSYIRNKLTDFWMGESKKIQKAMGFSSPAIVTFDDAVFSDEISYKKLLIELYDRDVLTQEGLREEFNIIESVENGRQLRETKRRKNGKMPPKASPYHDPMVKEKLTSDLIKSGNIDGDEMNIDVKKEDVFSKDKGGRPVGTRDSVKRDTKNVSPKKAFAADFLEMKVWARESFDKISDVIGPNYLKEVGKNNFRQLTQEEAEDFENIKLSILCSINPFSDISKDVIQASAESIKDITLEKEIRNNLINELSLKMNRIPTMDDKRTAASAAYCISKLAEN